MEELKPTDSQQEINIRKLSTQDFWHIINIIRKGGKEAIAKLRETTGEDGDDTSRAFIILDIGMEFAQKELSVWFASLAKMSLEDYQAADFDATLTIVEQLEEREDLGNFTKRVANLAQKFLPNKALKVGAEPTIQPAARSSI